MVNYKKMALALTLVIAGIIGGQAPLFHAGAGMMGDALEEAR